MNKNIAAIILAAGKGERMKSATPKVLHPVCGRPMLEYVLDLTRELKVKSTVLVLGHKADEVKKHVRTGIRPVIQKRLVGTADAVKVALSALKSFKGTCLLLYGDIPLLKKETIKGLIEYHQKNNLDATILTAALDKPKGYGRVLRDRLASISGIVEEKDADDYQKEIKEINTGIICFDKAKLEAALKSVKPNNRKKEYYLTDVINIFYKKGFITSAVKIADINEAMGINSRVDLARANKIMQQRINEKLMLEGVGIVDPATTFINYGTKIGQDTQIYPFTVIENDVKIGIRCSVGPFAHLREGTRIENDCLVGNFLEIVRSRLSAKTLVKHFSYLGDASIGCNVNIGAGTVIANFDGKNKQPTVVGDNAFVGSDSVLVAPVKVGRNARTGAGSVVIKNVPRGATVVGVPAKLLLKRKNNIVRRS